MASACLLSQRQLPSFPHFSFQPILYVTSNDPVFDTRILQSSTINQGLVFVFFKGFFFNVRLSVCIADCCIHRVPEG